MYLLIHIYKLYMHTYTRLWQIHNTLYFSVFFVFIFYILSVCMQVCSVTQSGLALWTPWTVARQAPLSLEFPRQEYWSGLPFPTRGSSWPRDGSCIACVSCIGRWILYHLGHLGSPFGSLYVAIFCTWYIVYFCITVLTYRLPSQRHNTKGRLWSAVASFVADTPGQWMVYSVVLGPRLLPSCDIAFLWSLG